MPEICRFYGIIIRIYYDDHPPPHFHAVCGDDEAKIDIGTGKVISGNLPKRALILISEWRLLHEAELNVCWQRARQQQQPGRIDPLE
jgi:Domain of unknown function (DUF4160)